MTATVRIALGGVALGGSGGLGYLSKDTVEDGEELSRAIQRVGKRQRVLDPQLVRDLMARRREKPLDEVLTERELAVLRLIAEGRANKAIADTLYVSTKTVEDHSRSPFSKLGVVPAPGHNERVLAVLEWLRAVRMTPLPADAMTTSPPVSPESLSPGTVPPWQSAAARAGLRHRRRCRVRRGGAVADGPLSARRYSPPTWSCPADSQSARP